MEIILAGTSDRFPISTSCQTSRWRILANFVDGYKTAAASPIPTNSTLIERISAGYLMNTMDFGRLHVVAAYALKARR